MLKVDGGAAKVALHGHNLSFGLGSAMMSGNGAEARLLARRVLNEFPESTSGLLVKGYQAFAPPRRPSPTPSASRSPRTCSTRRRGATPAASPRRGPGTPPRPQAESDALKALKLDAKADRDDRDGKALMQAELDGRIALSQGRLGDAIPLLRRAADLRDRLDTSLDPAALGVVAPACAGRRAATVR